MLISKVSILSGKTHQREINVTPEQIADWKSGSLIQNAMPNLSPDDREFFMSGITPEEWDCVFDDEEFDIENNDGDC